MSTYMYCMRLVKTAKFIPNVTECASAFNPAVDAIPINPNSTTGQHQLPIKAGIDRTIIPIETNTPRRPSAISGVDGAANPGIDHAILTLARERKK